MKLLRSKRGIPIPKLYFISESKSIGDIPKGVPYIYGDEDMEDYLVRILEYEVLYQRAVKLGYPFDFKEILISNGFEDIRDFGYSKTSRSARMSIKTEGDIKYESIEDMPLMKSSIEEFKTYVKDSSVYVDISILKGLKIFPLWMEKVEDAISTNISTFATWDTNMYNKKLDGMYGGVKLTPPHKNLIIIDISGSIPRAVSTTCLALAKNMAESFYADLLITGSKSTLYDYSQVSSLDVRTVYNENGIDNDQVFFKKLVTEIQRDYDTAIIFGDDHTPGYAWNNKFNRDTRTISSRDGKKICKWNINQIVSFHTHNHDLVAGYGDWFEPSKITHIEDWVKDLRS